MCDSEPSRVKGSEPIHRLREYARQRELGFRVERNRGKGSHQTVHVGDRRSVMPDPRKELKPGTLAQVLRNLGVESLFRYNELP